MKKTRKIILILMAIVISSIAAASALFMYNIAFPQQITRPPDNGAITMAFDDGWLSTYEYAWPLMKERGMVGTFYIVSGLIGHANRLGPTELLDLQKHGCEIASHSHTHPDFTTLLESEIRDECVTSKEILESYGLRINNFAYPPRKI